MIHSGDFLNYDSKIEDFYTFYNQIKNLDFEYKIIVPGNHDLLLDIFKNENA